MARQQYILRGEGNWQSMFGRALIAITNISGSGRKLTLRSLDVSVNTISGASSAQISRSILYKGASISGGEDMGARVGEMDSTATLPSTVKVSKGGMIDVYTARLRSITAARFGAAAGTQNTLNNANAIGRFRGIYGSPRRGSESIVEPLFVRQNEAYALVPDVVNATSCLRVTVNVTVDGKAFVWSYVTNTAPGVAMFGITNTSTNVVKITSILLQEVGTTDTPYIRLVPIGQVYADDSIDNTSQGIQIIPVNSAYGALSSSVCKVYSDVGLIPLGVPEKYITDGSTGTPKGFSYLHTKDFDGPTFKVFFPEMCVIKPGGANEDMLGHGIGHKNNDIGVRGAGLVINPGEGLALVASAETAVGVTASFSGWTSLTFSAIIDNEPVSSPYLTVTGLQSGSDVVIITPGSTTVLTSVDQVVGSSFSWNYDPDVVTSADICIYKEGYVPYMIRNLTLSVSGATIPVSQVVDRAYII